MHKHLSAYTEVILTGSGARGRWSAGGVGACEGAPTPWTVLLSSRSLDRSSNWAWVFDPGGQDEWGNQSIDTVSISMYEIHQPTLTVCCPKRCSSSRKSPAMYPALGATSGLSRWMCRSPFLKLHPSDFIIQARTSRTGTKTKLQNANTLVPIV